MFLDFIKMSDEELNKKYLELQKKMNMASVSGHLDLALQLQFESYLDQIVAEQKERRFMARIREQEELQKRAEKKSKKQGKKSLDKFIDD